MAIAPIHSWTSNVQEMVSGREQRLSFRLLFRAKVKYLMSRKLF